jgi:DNA-binding response OmpR family regulator
MTARSEQRILVVDDAQSHRYALARGLRAHGFSTLEAATGSEALEMAPQAAAVVLDVNLPDIHGLEVCRQLRAQAETADMPIVHVSAVFVTGYHRAMGGHAGADDYLVSPVDPKGLASTLERLIATRAAAAAR